MASLDLTNVTEVSTEPGELPEKMTAWVIREERQGEPRDAFQLEEIEVPEPGAFEVIVRVMAAGVNYNNVWAALGQPVGGLDATATTPSSATTSAARTPRGSSGRSARASPAGSPATRSSIHCNMASYEDPEVHGLDPMAAPSQMIWGYETTWGSLRPVHQGPGPAAAAQAQAPDLGGGRLLRPRLLHRLPDADGPVQPPGRPQGADLGRRRRPRRVRRAAVRRWPAPSAWRVVSSRGEGQARASSSAPPAGSTATSTRA